MNGELGSVWLVAGLILLLLGATKLLYVPLAVAFEVRAGLRRREVGLADDALSVSVIVPAYDEAVVLENCLSSILTSDHHDLEVIVVDDGSTDDTLLIARRFAEADDRVVVVTQPNAGKGAALNAGIARSRGDILLFVDADGIFQPDTVTEMLRGFDHPRVGAVCGDDRPVNLDRPQTRLLALISHVGTGLVRRALHMIRALPIVSGNIGAFRREIIESVGGFDETTVGEDLELTWRARRAGFHIAFRPTALVYAESPSTFRALWRQRVRWARGYLQTVRTHWRMIGNLRYGVFGAHLALNAVAMILVPVVQLLVLVTLPVAIMLGASPVDLEPIAILGWLGLGVAAVVLARVGERQALEHAAWLVGTRRALLVVGLTAVAATVCAHVVTAPLVTLAAPAAIVLGIVLVLVDMAVRTRRSSRQRADLRDTDTREALGVLDSLGTWNLLLAPILLTWLALALL